MSDLNYWAHCKGAKGTKAIYKNLNAFSPMQARIEATSRWKWEHPGEALATMLIDCVETSYEMTHKSAI